MHLTHTQTMLRAAQLLEADAKCLKESHTLANGSWYPGDEFAKSDHDERIKIAAILRLLAKPF